MLVADLLLYFSYSTGTGSDRLLNASLLGGTMVVLWVLELIPIYVTALLPLIFGIPLNVIGKGQLATAYGDHNIYLFFGGFILALALEKWHVHRQIALRIISLAGRGQANILLGFLLSTGLLSMWISNTATALMMLPMALAVIGALPERYQNGKFVVFLLLSVAYGSNVGGMATLVGSPPNTQMASILGEAGIEVDFISWMKFGMPLSIAMLILIFVIFYLFLDRGTRRKPIEFELEAKPWTVNQKRVLLVFSMLVLLWSLRKYIIDWTGIAYGDESAALFASLLLFLIPSKEGKGKLLEWSDMSRVPWGILLLFGGGLALAKVLETSGALDQVVNGMGDLKTMAYPLMLLLLLCLSIFGTEVMSNLALVTILTPILLKTAMESHYDALELCLPVALAASCAFMLPVGTPPNAIIFASGQVKISDMARYGFIVNLVALGLIWTVFLCFS